MATCPYCANTPRWNAPTDHCPKCAGAVKQCQSCDEANVVIARFCRECGSTLQNILQWDTPSGLTRFTLAWSDPLDRSGDDVKCGVIADRFFLAIGDETWRLYAPFPSKSKPYATALAPAGPLAGSPCLISGNLVFPCRSGLWTLPVAHAWRLNGGIATLQNVWTGEVAAWKAERGSAVFADARGAIHQFREGGAQEVHSLDWVPRQVSIYKGRIVALGERGLVTLGTQEMISGDFRLASSSQHALLLLKGRQLLLAWHDDRWRTTPIGDDMASGFFLSEPSPHGIVVGVPVVDRKLHAFRLRFPLPPEPLHSWPSATEIWFHRGGDPACGHSFVLAAKDPNTNRVRLRAYTVSPDTSLSRPVTSNSIEELLAGPFLAGGVVYAVAKVAGKPTVQCYHLFSSAG